MTDETPSLADAESDPALVEAELQPGQRLLVTAAASGVGSAAVQIGRARGAFVIGSASAGKLAAVTPLGAVATLERDQPDFVDALRRLSGGRGVDAIVDFVGGSAPPRHQASLAERGRLIVVGLLGGASAALDLGRVLMKRQRICGLVMRSRSVAEKILLGLRMDAIRSQLARNQAAMVAEGALAELYRRALGAQANVTRTT